MNLVIKDLCEKILKCDRSMCEDLLVHVDKGGTCMSNSPLLVVAGHDKHGRPSLMAKTCHRHVLLVHHGWKKIK